jgi:hypothetical protein
MSLSFASQVKALLQRHTRRFPGIVSSHASSPQSMVASIEALRMATETMLRQRGNVDDSAVLVRDLVAVTQAMQEFVYDQLEIDISTGAVSPDAVDTQWAYNGDGTVDTVDSSAGTLVYTYSGGQLDTVLTPKGQTLTLSYLGDGSIDTITVT